MIRAAAADDSPALGRVMVESWLSAHRGLIPDAAWQKRADEWTPEVSAEAWLRFFAAQAEGQAPRTALLVAELVARLLRYQTYSCCPPVAVKVSAVRSCARLRASWQRMV